MDSRSEQSLQPVPHSHTTFPVRETAWRNSSVYNNHDSLVREYFRVLVKRRWVVLITMAVIFGAAIVATLRTTKVYEAVGRVAINKDDAMPITFKDSENFEDTFTDSTDMETEVRVLGSDLLALQVIRQLNLDKPTTSVARKPGLSLTPDALDPNSELTSQALASFKSSLGVTLVTNTRVIEITYRSPDKNLAARVVNTLASTYVEQNFKTRFESTMQASEWLSKQLVDLQMKVESSQEKLVKYEKEHDILGVDEKQNLTTTKLDELNRDLTAAESARMEKESLYRMAEAGGSDSLNAINGAQPTRSGDQSSLLDRLRDQEAQLKIQQAQLSTQFGPSYPKVVQLNSQLKELDVQIQVETKKIVGGLRGDYLAALQRENLLHGALDQQKQEANKLNENAIEYNLLKRDLDTNRTLYESLLQKLKEAGITASLKSNNFRIIDPARIPSSPVEPNIPRNFALALALGLSTGIGLGFLIDGLDNSVRTPEQAQAISGLPSLGMIPLGSRSMTEFEKKPRLASGSSKEAVELVTQARPQSRMAEAYRALRTSLLLTSAGTPPKTILVTSALPQEGKTTTSINCAVVLAQKGSRVLLVDADLRRPGVHKTLGMGPCAGLSNVLTNSATLQQAIVRSSILPNLFILPAGTPPPNPAELLASTNMKDLLAELRADYDHIVIDTPPTLSVTDAVIMATRADTVILVIRSGQTTRQALQRSRDLLTQVNAHIAGVLLNAADLDSADYRYHYEYQGKYGDRYYQDGSADLPVESAPKAAIRDL
ncbi:MAG: polysaccharide biosynthesis tyrosine autokinase [Terriglobales bacterium]